MRHKLTIAKSVSLSGVGIHSGQFVKLRFIPLDSGEIVFRRSDLDGMDFRIDPHNMAANNSSNLIRGEHQVLTIEHLMASLYASGVDSILVEMDGTEVPILDGSALPFMDALEKAGTQELDIHRKHLAIKKEFVIQEEDASLHVSPADSLNIDYSIRFDHPVIGSQKLSFSLDKFGFVSQIAPARTFGFLKDVPELHEKQLALGGSFENALVLDEKNVINGPLRFPDEFVRHKILDLIGDLSIMGYPLMGQFTADRAGHRLHLRTVRFLLENPDVWFLV